MSVLIGGDGLDAAEDRGPLALRLTDPQFFHHLPLRLTLPRSRAAALNQNRIRVPRKGVLLGSLTFGYAGSEGEEEEGR